MRCHVTCLPMMLLAFSMTPYACAQEKSAGEEDSGVYVRLLTIEVDPADAEEWEIAVQRIAGAARQSDLESCCDWLLYREGPYRYHAVFFSEGLADLDTPESFGRAFAGTPGEAAFREGVRGLQATRYEVTADVVHQMVAGWSTVEGISTATHPKARLTRYWVRPGAEEAFDAAMREHAKLLKAVEYPYPVEGFHWRLGSPNVNYVNVFPDAWAGFFGENDIRAVLRRHDREAEYDALLKRIAATVLRLEHHDIDYASSLSY